MQLVADRFVVRDDGAAIDLATGQSVVLTIAGAGGCADQTRWAVRCHALHTLHHPAIAPLVDGGLSAFCLAWICLTALSRSNGLIPAFLALTLMRSHFGASS